MLPPKTNEKWELLVTGKIKFKFKAFAGNMIVSRVQRYVQMDMNPENIKKGIEEIHTFFSKYENVYRSDLQKLFK